MRVRLELDSLAVEIAPEVGGGVATFVHDGCDLFRPAARDAVDPTALGEFPMAPYVNRIAHGRFHWRGETIVLPAILGDHPHPLHGVGWRSAWTCERLSAHAARLTLTRQADADWPWRVTMTRVITLTPAGLEIAFSLTNADTRPMPASIGLHPHFPAAGATVRLGVTAQVLTTADGIPVEILRTPAVDALAAGARVADLALDHCFAGWDGRAELTWPNRTLRIETDPPQRFVQVYTPAGADFFCVEPQSAAPDAVNREASGVVELAPGETLAFATRFAIA